MTRQTGTPDPEMSALHGELHDLGGVLLAVPTPDLLPHVMHRIATEPAPSRRRIDWRRPWVRMLSVALVVLAGSTGVLAGSASARNTLAELLGLPGVTITHAPAGAKPSPPALAPLHLGRRVSLAEARGVVSFPITAPTMPGIGAPDGIYVLPARVGSVVSLTYRPHPGLPAAPETGTGLLLNQFAGSFEQPILQKILYGGSEVQRVKVNGHNGIWIKSPHELINFNGFGFASRASANSLIWEVAGVIMRLEAALPLDRMMLIAQSVR